MNKKFIVITKARTNEGANVESLKTFHLFELLFHGINLALQSATGFCLLCISHIIIQAKNEKKKQKTRLNLSILFP